MRDNASNPLEEFRIANVEATRTLALQAAACGVMRFVFVSSVKVNGESTLPGQRFQEDDVPAPQDAYGTSKLEAEMALRRVAAETDMEVVIIRSPLVYGYGVKANFSALINAVRNGWPLPLGAVHNQRSMVALGNLIDFILTCITHPAAANQTFLVSDGHDFSTTELLQSLAKVANVPARFWPIPVPILRLAGRLTGKSSEVDRLCGNLQIDISKARNMLGWTPPLSVEEGLKQVAG
jgi:nucleoside-diphosphate-sugar epimerase